MAWGLETTMCKTCWQAVATADDASITLPKMRTSVDDLNGKVNGASKMSDTIHFH